MKKHYALFLLLFLTVVAGAQNQYGWIQRASMPAVGRHRACGCAVGNRGYIGLGHINNMTGEIIYNDWWEYDPGTDSWMQRANFGGGIRYHAIAFSIGNFAYVGTGSGNWGDTDDLWKYNPVTNSWVMVSVVPGGVRSGAVAFTINNKGYVCLGDFQTDCWEYDPATNGWTQKAYFPGTSIYSAVGAVENGKAYVGTGTGTSQWYEFDPVNNLWTVKANFPGTPRFGSGCFSLNGWVYVVSGSDWGTEFHDTWAYNPATNGWTQVYDFPGAGRHYFTCFTIGNHAYGGTGTSGTNYNDFWEYGYLSGVEEHKNSAAALNIFPNPLQTEATLSFDGDQLQEGELLIYALDGKIVRRETLAAGKQWNLDRGSLAAGVYELVLNAAGKTQAAGKLLVE